MHSHHANHSSSACPRSLCTQAQENVIQAEDLTKVYRDFWHRPKVRAVDGITFRVRRGQVVGLLGPNGSGKSTTVKLLMGLLRPTSGMLSVLGEPPSHVRIKSRIGYLPEESYHYPYLTAVESLTFYAKLFDLPPVAIKKRIQELLEWAGLQRAQDQRAGEYSKGMLRRLGIAQALINEPELVVLDEPTAGLDPLGCRSIKDLILSLAANGTTVLLSSHLLADVEDVCDRIVLLYNGKIQTQGAIAELLEDTHRYRLLLDAPTPEQIELLKKQLAQMKGLRVQWTHPKRTLEHFFVDVVEEAQQDRDPQA